MRDRCLAATTESASRDALAKKVGRAPFAAPQILTTARQALAALQTAHPGVEATLSAVTGGAVLVRNLRKPLAEQGPGDTSFDTVRRFVIRNAELYGLRPDDLASLRLIGESGSPGGLRTVRVEQVVNGLSVFPSEVRFSLDRDGRLVRSDGGFASGVSVALPPRAAIAPAEALAAAAAGVGMPIDAAGVTVESRDGRQLLRLEDARISDEVPCELMYFALEPGMVLPAWRLVVSTSGPGDYTVFIDASAGTMLWRRNNRRSS